MYESENNELILDGCMYPDASVIDNLYMSEIRRGEVFDAFPAQLRRYRLPIDDINDECRQFQADLKRYETGLDFELIHPSYEMPKINYDTFNGKVYKYTYGIGYSTVRRGLSTLLKVKITFFLCDFNRGACPGGRRGSCPHPGGEGGAKRALRIGPF